MLRSIVVVGVLVSSLGATQLRGSLAETLSASLAPEDVYYLPADPSVLQLLCLQYRETAADLLWMKALLYYSEHLAERSNAEYAVRYGEALVALDPDFEEIYRWTGSVPFYLSVEAPLEMKVAGSRLLVQGSDRMPFSGRLAWEAAATVTYELLPIMPADHPEQQRFEADSERLLARAVRLGAGPAWLSLNSASASVRMGRTEAAIQNLERTLAITDDEHLRVQILARLSELTETSRYIETESEHRRLSAEHQRTFPYLLESEFLVFGERRLPMLEQAR